MATNLDRITAEVAEMTSAADSAAALLAELATMIRANAEDTAALNALADTLDSKGTALAAAVEANTISAEGPPPIEDPNGPPSE